MFDKIAKSLANATVMAFEKHIVLLSIDEPPCLSLRLLRIATMRASEIIQIL
jgi:hypothetical protein